MVCGRSGFLWSKPNRKKCDHKNKAQQIEKIFYFVMIHPFFDMDASNRHSSQNWFDFMLFMVGCDEIEAEGNLGGLF